MKLWRILIGASALAAAAAAGVALRWIHQPMPLASDTVEVSIDPGTTPREIAQAWVQAGVQVSPLWLYEWFRWSGQSRKMRAGSYEIGPGVTPQGLLSKLVRGDESLAVVRLIDGWTFRQFRAELARADALKPTTTELSDEQIMQALGAAGVNPEGRFQPDTYAYSKGSSDLAVLRRAFRAMQRQLDAAWQARDPATPLRTVDDALVLASIVEKETGIGADRGRVAGVFTNRLRLGMPLQTDPSVIYGLGAAYDGSLHKRDLLTDTPYNTYTRAGLPPTPISMPSKAALYAAVHPDATKALYFVARGDGSSEFSETLSDHNRAVNQYLRSGTTHAK
jgi:UPF0755 protein